jgi:carbohydrate-binding DOMON domain-containing protein
MLNFEKTLDMLGGLTLLKFFPSDPGARLELAKLVGRMASNEAQVEWLVQRTTALCNEWPGPLALRQIFCSKFKPADGIEAGGTSMFPDGPPSEQKIEAPSLPALPAGHVATVDAGYDRAIRLLAAAKDMDRLKRVAIQEAPTNPDFKPITQADVDRAVDELHEKRARAELGLE